VIRELHGDLKSCGMKREGISADGELNEIDDSCSAMYRLENPARRWTMDELEQDSKQAGLTAANAGSSEMQTKWTVEFDERAQRELRKAAVEMQTSILADLRNRIGYSADPRVLGQPLRMRPADLWTYRVTDYRLICSLEEDRSVVLVLKIGRCREA
jgi:mRNA interferase RelE/StbE